MSFNDFESSISEGQSARLYQFDRSATVVWRYTSADRPLQFGGHEWLPLPISDDGIRLAGEASADALIVTLPSTSPVALLFRGVPPSTEVFVTVFDYDASAQDAEACWLGNVSSAKWPAIGTAELACDSLSASMNREGLRLRYERTCPHSVYDDECSALKQDFGVSAEVLSLDGRDLELALATDVPLTIFNYGALEWTVDGSTEWRGIETVVNGRVTLAGGTIGLSVGQAVTLYPGCDGTRSMCSNRFNNLLNHGGFAHMPGKSIFNGERIW